MHLDRMFTEEPFFSHVRLWGQCHCTQMQLWPSVFYFIAKSFLKIVARRKESAPYFLLLMRQ